MLSRNLKRALFDSRLPIPPTFLLPWAAKLTTATSALPNSSNTPPISTINSQSPQPNIIQSSSTSRTIDLEKPALPAPGTGTPSISSSVRELLPLLRAQGPHYITAHIHGQPYLLTQGDTIKLPHLIHGVEPGDVLRLNRAINLGSRDFTMKAAAAAPRLKSPTVATTSVLDPTNSGHVSISRVMPDTQGGPVVRESGAIQYAPHFIPNIAKGKHSYLDERLFVCRAIVMGVEREPLRIKEKTKRRQRHIRRIKSQHSFTILKVKELRIRDIEEIDAMGQEQAVVRNA